MSIEGMGQARARSEEAAFRDDAEGRGRDLRMNAAPDIEEIDGSELTAGYEGYSNFESNLAQRASSIPVHTEAPEGVWPRLIMDEEELATGEAFKSAESEAVVMDMAAQEAAVDASPNVVRIEDVRNEREAERLAKLKELEERVLNNNVTNQAETASPKEGWLKRIFGG